jgi:hypothetical protein
MLADALSRLPFDEEQKAYASPSHDKHKHNIQAITSLHLNSQVITSSSQRVMNDDLVHVRPNNYFSSAVGGQSYRLFPSSPYVGEYSLHTYVCKHCTGSAWGCSAAATVCTKAQSVYMKTMSLWCYQKAQYQPWRIYLPQDMLECTVKWYHHALSHVGRVQLSDTMSMTFYNPQLHYTKL